MQIIDDNLLEIKKLDAQAEKIETKKEQLRKEILGALEDNGLTETGYKNATGSVSYVQKTKIEVENEPEVAAELRKQQIVKYIEHIPEHDELNKKFKEDVKGGKFAADFPQLMQNIKVTPEDPTIQIKFAK